MIPPVDRRHPDHYRFDNPSSVAAVDNYQMPHWTKRRIEIHLRCPSWMNIHQKINHRATLQNAERVSKAHKFRRAWNAEIKHGKRYRLPYGFNEFLRRDRMQSVVAWSTYKAMMNTSR